MKNKKILYYKDESKDDFQNTKTVLSVNVDGNYNYLPKNVFFKIFSFWFYHLFAFPILFLLNRFFGLNVKGRRHLKAVRKQGFFIYANHTSFRDSWLGAVSVAPFKKVYIISNKDAIQIPVVNILTKAGGVLPVADTVSGLKNLNLAIDTLVKKKKVVTIFPEAHIWPYYTKLRPFPLTSFRLSAMTNSPAVPVAVCYKKRKLFGDRRKPKMYIFIGKPIFPKPELSERENAVYLKEEVFYYIQQTLQKESTYEYIEYVKLPQIAQQKQIDEVEQKKEII